MIVQKVGCDTLTTLDHTTWWWRRWRWWWWWGWWGVLWCLWSGSWSPHSTPGKNPSEHSGKHGITVNDIDDEIVKSKLIKRKKNKIYEAAKNTFQARTTKVTWQIEVALSSFSILCHRWTSQPNWLDYVTPGNFSFLNSMKHILNQDSWLCLLDIPWISRIKLKPMLVLHLSSCDSGWRKEDQSIGSTSISISSSWWSAACRADSCGY